MFGLFKKKILKTEEEKRALCSIAREVRPDFIKTSTGFGTGGATFEDVALMKKCVGDEVKIKAAGGIRTLEDGQALVEELMAQGTSQRDAVKQAAKTLGLSRNQLYDAVVGK